MGMHLHVFGAIFYTNFSEILQERASISIGIYLQKRWNVKNISIIQIQNQYFFLLIANWYLPLSHVYLPIDWKMKVKNNDDLHKDLEDKLGHPKLFLVLYAPENDAKPSPDWLNTNKHT